MYSRIFFFMFSVCFSSKFVFNVGSYELSGVGFNFLFAPQVQKHASGNFSIMSYVAFLILLHALRYIGRRKGGGVDVITVTSNW